MEKRSCIRFHVPGATLCYRKKSLFWRRGGYGEDRFPILDMSRGGVRIVSDSRSKIGLKIDVQIHLPEMEQALEMTAEVRWVGRNPETSYRFQTGIAFAPYGTGKNENPTEVLDRLKALESIYGAGRDTA